MSASSGAPSLSVENSSGGGAAFSLIEVKIEYCEVDFYYGALFGI